MDLTDLPLSLVIAMKLRNTTMTELSEKSDLHMNTIFKVKRGDTYSSKTVEKLAKALGMTTPQLMDLSRAVLYVLPDEIYTDYLVARDGP